MKKIILILLPLLTVTCTFAQTATTDTNSVWLELVDNTQSLSSMEVLTQELKQQIKDKMPNITDSTLQQVMDTMDTMILEYVKNSVIPACKQQFSLQEAQQINAFYRSPLGTKLKEAQPLIIEQTSKDLLTFGSSLNDKIMNMLEQAKSK